MATSISKEQAKALADGFFDNIGSTKEGLQPEETLSALYQLAGGLVEQAQQNLVNADRVSSGALSASMKVLNPEYVNSQIRIDIEALYYYKFVDQGVKGTQGGAGKYSFKNNGVGKKMLYAIRKWVIKEGLKARADKYTINKREHHRKSISKTSDNVAYAIAKYIKKKGLKRTGFFTNAVKETQNDVRGKLEKSFKIDIINSLPNKLG